ncbi:MAG: penicillin-insensitive murein endopeptidase [Polyangiaceae bacterium]|nr:penicillin-insensitive murein endopeptidase [Polyangiaceae bacterium]
MSRRRRPGRGPGRALVAASPLLAAACFSSPTPLAPGVGGSVGAPQHGVLTDGVELPAGGPGFVRYRPHGQHHWGTPVLVAAVERAAARVSTERGGEPLVVGDLSARRGGKIPGHRSHRSGRDVDLLFYTTTPEGAPVRSPGFLHFGADGLARVQGTDDYVRFDVARNWALIESLVGSEGAPVLFIFVSRELEALLLEWAFALGSPDSLLLRAATVMLQPGDSTPHDDHFHVRLACSAEEALRGCDGGGPRWRWLPPLEEAAPLDDALLAAIAEDEGPPAAPEDSAGDDAPQDDSS